MEDHRRTRSQGLSEGAQLIQWNSLQDPVRIEREQAEARRWAREANTVININERAVENSEISQVTEGQPRFTAKVPRLGEISPNQQGQEGHTNVMPKLGEISQWKKGQGHKHPTRMYTVTQRRRMDHKVKKTRRKNHHRWTQHSTIWTIISRM